MPQYLYYRIPVDQLTTLGLLKARRDVGGYFLALPEHPVLKIELLADDLERLIEDFTWVLVRLRLDGRSRVAARASDQSSWVPSSRQSMNNCSDLPGVVKREKTRQTYSKKIHFH